jgi:hypothetical protein
MNKLQRGLICIIGTAGLITLAGCAPEIKKIKDFDHDGNPDVIIKDIWDTYLFLSQKDGNYMRMKYSRIEKCFKSKDGWCIYFSNKKDDLIKPPIYIKEDN